jgi:ribonuclease D
MGYDDNWTEHIPVMTSPPLLSPEPEPYLEEILPEEPSEVLLVNSTRSGSYDLLCRDAAEADVVAFDAEWRPDRSEEDDNPISVLQLAFPESRRVYVVQVGRLGGKLPVAVQMMLVNPAVIKAGYAVDRSDVAKMQRTGIAVTRDSVVDVQCRCAEAIGFFDDRKNQDSRGVSGAESLGMKKSAQKLLGVEMDKRMACSDWASERLSVDQIRYAALDAWITLRLYYRTADSVL